MTRKITKGKAFVIATISIVAVHFGTLLILSIDPSSGTLAALVAVASMYIIGSVTDNGVKGKYFQEGLQPPVESGK